MKKIILLLVFSLFLIQNVNAIVYTYNDDFSSYGNNYFIYDDTGDLNGLTLNFDANTANLDYNLLRLGNSSIKVSCIKSQSADARCSQTTYHSPINVSDYNANGRLFYWMYIDGNAPQVWRFDTRDGDKDTNYYSMNSNNFGSTTEPGWSLIPFDLNNILLCGGQCGTFNGWSFTETALHNDLFGPTYSSDYNYRVNMLWMEKGNYPIGCQAFNGTWCMIFIQANPMGWANPMTRNGKTMINFASTDRTLVQRRSRLNFIPTSGMNYNAIDYNLHLQADVNRVFTSTATKIFFDYNGPANYSTAYIEDVNSTTANIGIEQIIGGVRQFNQTSYPITYNKFYTLSLITNGIDANVYLDGVLAHDGNVVSRVEGDMGLEIQGGRTEFTNVQIQLSTTNSFVGSQAILGTPNFNLLTQVLLPLLFLALLGLLLIVGLKNGDPVVIIFTALVVIIVYVVYTQLFP